MPLSKGFFGTGPQALSRNRDLWHVLPSIGCALGHRRRATIVTVCGIAMVGLAATALAQAPREQQIRCMQLEQELTAARGGRGGADVGAIDEQIQHFDRIHKGTRAAMEDAGCFERFLFFGRGLVRSPKCLKMNQRLDDARRQLSQLQQQREAMRGGGGSRRQAELKDALARNGCDRGQARRAARRGGGLFDWFGGGNRGEAEQPGAQISRRIDPGGRYRSICVRLCDGFFYPISYSTYAGRLSQDAERCQSNCAAPAELYVYRNPGHGPEQAISLNGSAYVDLPVAFKYRKEYVKGCSCKQTEYNPTEIEAANKKAEAGPEQGKGKPAAKKRAAKKAAAAAPGDASGEQAPPPQLDLDISGSSLGDEPEAVAQEEAPAPPAETPAAAAPPAQQPAGPAVSQQGQSTVVKRRATPVTPQ